jgi:hypothetical protein
MENPNERPSSPTHAGEEINTNINQDYTEPNVLGAAPCSPFDDSRLTELLKYASKSLGEGYDNVKDGINNLIASIEETNPKKSIGLATKACDLLQVTPFDVSLAQKLGAPYAHFLSLAHSCR